MTDISFETSDSSSSSSDYNTPIPIPPIKRLQKRLNSHKFNIKKINDCELRSNLVIKANEFVTSSRSDHKKIVKWAISEIRPFIKTKNVQNSNNLIQKINPKYKLKSNRNGASKKVQSIDSDSSNFYIKQSIKQDSFIKEQNIQ